MLTRRLDQMVIALWMTLVVCSLAFAQRLDPVQAGIPVPGSGESLVSIIVKLEDEPLATYDGGISGLRATSPESTGARRLNVRSRPSQAYLAYLARKHRAFEAAALRAIPTARIVHRYRVVFGGVSMLVPQRLVDRIRRLPGVQAVYPDRLERPTTDRSPFFLSADHLWTALGGQEAAGEGVVVGVLDTGIWPEHPSFADPDPSGKPYPAPPAGWGGVCEPPSDGSPPLLCTHKLIGARKFLATYISWIGLQPGEFNSARDSQGHGTHTASTAAGNVGVEASVFDIPRGIISGIAPRAHIAMYRVCAREGCATSDSVAAIEQAVADGVDVINFSISGGTQPYADPVELSFLGAYAAGVFVAASAGNDGPTPDTVMHRGGWVTTVAASNTDRFFLSQVTLTADGGASLNLTGASVTHGISVPTPVVLAQNFGDELCGNSFPAGTFTGQIVVCKRGGNARVEKGFNVKAGGAGGMLLYNPELQGLLVDNHFLPAVHLENDTGAALLAFLSGHIGVTATFPAGAATSVQGDVMAAFSSRGGPRQPFGISKPDVTAPGVQILAGHTPQPDDALNGPAGELFRTIQGTSMSSPHVAGAAALLRALHPTWSPGQIKSALMTSANTLGVFKEDGITPMDPFDAGSGRIDLSRAGDPGLTFNARALSYLLRASRLWTVNYPSLFVPALSGTLTVRRTAHSELSEPGLWDLQVSAPSDLQVDVPATLTVPAGGNKTFRITVNATAVPSGEVRHAMLRLMSGERLVQFPITIVRR